MNPNKVNLKIIYFVLNIYYLFENESSTLWKFNFNIIKLWNWNYSIIEGDKKQ